MDPVAPTAPARLGDRTLFPDLAWRVYLNHAAISAPSAPVVAMTRAIVDDYARRGFTAFLDWHEQRERVRARFAGMINARSEDIGLVQSTTRGVIDIALCFPWRPKDRVVLYEGEFPANVTPWQRAAELFDLEVVFLPLSDFADENGPGLERLQTALDRGVRLVAVSAVAFQTGWRMPLAAMAARCHAAGAQLFVDAVQACGAVPIDVRAEGVDYLACGSHKWLMGLEGCGFLYVHPDRIAALRPNVAGWLSHEDGLGFLLEGKRGLLRYDRPVRQRIDFVEGGNLNAVGYAALDASLGILVELGPAAIAKHAGDYLDVLEAGLVERGFRSLRAKQPERRSCILGVLPPAETSVVRLHRDLAARGVACSIPDGVLRFAPSWPNHRDEVPIVLEAIDASR